jgi:DNA polymerase elongation subunit (family B)
LVARNSSHNAVKESYPGGYVMDAKGGLYDGLLCDFDFTSLYPSIINSWGIGPDTFLAKLTNEDDVFNLIYDRSKLKDKSIELTMDPIHNSKKTKVTLPELETLINDNDSQLNIAGTLFIGHDKHESIFYTVINSLFEGRKLYKKKMLEAKDRGDTAQANIFNGKQMAYKILANSLYGALGNEHFRFYNIDIAKSITLAGQELLKYCAVHCDDYMVNRGNITEFKMNTAFLNKVKSLTDVIYGDTDSIFVYLTDYLNDKNIEVKKSPAVNEEIQKIQDYINNVSLDTFLKLHNIQKDRSMIFLKNEYLFSKYYTLNGKKHYAAKVISQEGIDRNEIDIKGLEMKRSEIPTRSQQLLNEILDIILEDDIKKYEIKEQVDNLVSKTRVEMLELVDNRDGSIVRTVSYSKPLKEYKKLPQHIKAMLIWNCLMDEDFRYGTKGKLWNISGIDLEKAPQSVKDNFNVEFPKQFKNSDLNCICVPEDVAKLPPWFIPDIKKIMAYSCDGRVDNLTEPLWQESNQMLTF